MFIYLCSIYDKLPFFIFDPYTYIRAYIYIEYVISDAARVLNGLNTPDAFTKKSNGQLLFAYIRNFFKTS